MKTRFSRSESVRAVRKLRDESSKLPPRAWLELDAGALQDNYHAIRDMVPRQSVLPMIKADAYGHGAEWAARMLVGLPGLYGFGVATFEEGKQIREELGPRARRTKIVVFSGAAPWTEEKGQYCERYNLTPVIATDSDWTAFLRGGWPERLSYELKFNTGMNRLGLSPGIIKNLIRSLRALPTEAHPDAVFSHLAMAEDPEARVSYQQLDQFIALRGEIESAFPSTHFHLANSAGIWNHKYWQIDRLTDVVRPGLSLYGVPPWPGAPARGIRPVMSFKAQVINVHQLKPGDCVGYGATFRVEDSSVRVAVLSAGYADGVPRQFSNQGHVWVSGGAQRFVGRVSMDLSTISCPNSTQVGEVAEILGPLVDVWAQAQLAGTIPYELLTSVSARVQRVYV